MGLPYKYLVRTAYAIGLILYSGGKVPWEQSALKNPLGLFDALANSGAMQGEKQEPVKPVPAR